MNDASGYDFESAANTSAHTVRILVLSKSDGILTKRISLVDDENKPGRKKLRSDGSQCLMSYGIADQETLTLKAFGARIASLEPHQAITLGCLREGVPDRVKIETKHKLEDTIFPHGKPVDLIARTSDHIAYRPGQPALVLIDVDTKGIPDAVRARIEELGGPWGALVSIMPELAGVGHVTRLSTTSGISDPGTKQEFAGSGGMHIFILVKDGADAERFLRALHARCWVRGLGWGMIGKAGQFLKRSLIDMSVYAGERIVFESDPWLDPPLVQNKARRAPAVIEGPPLDSRAACPQPGLYEEAKLRELEAKARQELAGEAGEARARFIEEHAARIVAVTGCKPAAAKRVIERQCDGVLLPNIVLPFDDPDLANTTVADVLADPLRYAGETLSDPLEGPDYGVTKAIIIRRTDGSVFIHSFAHGRTIYELKHNAETITAAIMAGAEAEATDILVSMIVQAELDPEEEDRLRKLAAGRAKAGVVALKARIRGARAESEARHKAQARREKEAASDDQRPRLPHPPADAERSDVMDALNAILGAVDASLPPMRDLEGHMAQLVTRWTPGLHSLTSFGSNATEALEERKPPPAVTMLRRMEKYAVTEMIEKYMAFQDSRGNLVTLHGPFVEHYVERKNDQSLPVCATIATLPMVLPNGKLLAKKGLDRDTGILFVIPDDLLAALPKSSDECGDAAILKAMQFLCDEFLGDVAGDLVTKSVLLAFMASVVERTLLSNRPTFFVTAPRRGGGKTTVLVMMLYAITGAQPAAAAWSTNEEERRKALMAYLLDAPAAIIWDNINRGSKISCPHIEKACTSEFLSDRKLGVSEKVMASAGPIQAFTGNAIGPQGDLASRSLHAALVVDRPDPENRKFKHPDYIGWTKAHRYEILAHLFTILLGNPALKGNAPQPTRFKDWMRLVGTAIQHAASLYRNAAVADGIPHVPLVSFKDLFLAQEDGEEQSDDLVAVLEALDGKWKGGGAPNDDNPAATFTAADLAKELNQYSSFRWTDATTVFEWLYGDDPTIRKGDDVSAKSVAKRLKPHIGNMVRNGDFNLALKRDIPTNKRNDTIYWIHKKKA